jgi:catechol 2,3-dioxygenase-like lactoylglutathione lyase family enzyme
VTGASTAPENDPEAASVTNPILRHVLVLTGLVIAGPSLAQDNAVSVTLVNAAILVADRPATVKFFRDVMGYAETRTVERPAAEPDDPLGIPAGATSSLTGMTSQDGAGLAIIGVDSPDFRPLGRPAGAASAGGEVMLVHRVKNLKEIHARAVVAGYDIISPPKPSASGRSMSMMLRDPNHVRLEVYESIPPPN